MEVTTMRIDYGKCGKYFGYIFWLVIPQLIAGILGATNSRSVQMAGSVISLLCAIALAWFLWQLQSEDERLRLASILALASSILGFLGVLVSGKGDSGAIIAVSFVISIVSCIVSILYAITLYPAFSDIMRAPSPELSAKWLQIKQLYIVGLIVTLVGALLTFVTVVIAAVITMVGAVITMIAGIMELIATYRSSKACKEYAGPQL